MATLYQATATTRKVIIFFLIASIVILAFDIVQRAPKTTVVAVDPNRCYLPADAKEIIAAPAIPSLQGVTRQGSTYALEGVYTSLPDVAILYQIEKPREKLLVFETAQEVISDLGFDSNSFDDKGGSNYEWISEDGSKTLIFNKVNQIWNLKTKYEDNIDAIRRKTLSRNVDYYSNQLKRLISAAGWDIYGLDEAIYDIRYAKFDNGIFVEKTTPQESDYIFGSAYRSLRLASLKKGSDLPNTALCKASKDVDGQVFGTDPRFGQLSVIASENFTNYSRDLYSLDYINYEYNSKQIIHSIVKADEASTRIQTGSGALVQILPVNFNYFADYPTNISIRKFTADRTKTVLGYYEPKEWTGYVYPIYIFEGVAELTDGRKASFIFYVDAIKR